MIPPKPKPEHEPYDHITRWLINSRTDLQAAYLVDLAGNNGWGVCTCDYFVKQVKSKIIKGQTQNLRYCWHVPEAKRRMAEWQIWLATPEQRRQDDGP